MKEEDDFDIEEIEKEAEARDARMKKIEEEGVKNILKYFDRIHDKLFQFNNILIAGYYVLLKSLPNTPMALILIPIANLAILMYIEYSMMEKSRLESKITIIPIKDIGKIGKWISKTNLISLGTIGTTAFTTLVFLWTLLSYSK